MQLQYKDAGQKKKLSNDSDEARIYTKPEDEIFHKVVILIFCLSMPIFFTYIMYFF
jgi:hypothetical protein